MAYVSMEVIFLILGGTHGLFVLMLEKEFMCAMDSP